MSFETCILKVQVRRRVDQPEGVRGPDEGGVTRMPLTERIFCVTRVKIFLQLCSRLMYTEVRDGQFKYATRGFRTDYKQNHLSARLV